MEKTLKDFILELFWSGKSPDDIVEIFTDTLNEAEAELKAEKKEYTFAYGDEYVFADIADNVRQGTFDTTDIAILITELLVQPYFKRNPDCFICSDKTLGMLVEETGDMIEDFLETMDKPLSTVSKMETILPTMKG